MKALRYLKLLWDIGRQMGWYYWLFRAGYWLQGKTGILKLRFPRKVSSRSFVDIQEWGECRPRFLFDDQNFDLPINPDLSELKWRVMQIQAGRFPYFSNTWYAVADWHTHPLTRYQYPVNEHWSEVDDFPAQAGDIKFVWEKSRFTFLYDIIRYDYHFKEDQAETVFRLLADWIDHNPVNCGPNWKCSQEIALRVLNWTFALHYYRASPNLSQAKLDQILCSIYDQMRHVASNIRFSEVAVRNNHILSESLALFTTGCMFSFFPESLNWKQKGKDLFEREIVSQIKPDGTYLQYSMNYHRVVVQLLTWAIRLAERHSDRMCAQVYSRARAVLIFLRACQNNANGQLPNYGHNDGALFFPLTECEFRDFRPQMAALAAALGFDLGYQTGQWLEETWWLTGHRPEFPLMLNPQYLSAFHQSGYYIIRNAGTITFLRCGNCHSRPFQADQNHLDIWVNGRNILRDAGTWLYNGEEETTHYFCGTRSHNTVMIENFDQMQKQHRFIWTHWTRSAQGKSGVANEEFWIETEFEGFRHVGKGIVHKRRVVKKAGQLHWLVEDHILNLPSGMRIRQLWHPDAAFSDDFKINAVNELGVDIAMTVEEGWYSQGYGVKTRSSTLVFESKGSFIRAVITARAD